MSRDGTLLDLHTLEFKRLLPGPIELAWDYLTKPELLKTWFADVTLEPRVGGGVDVRFSMFAEIRRFWNAKLAELKRQMRRYKAAQTKEPTEPLSLKGRKP